MDERQKRLEELRVKLSAQVSYLSGQTREKKGLNIELHPSLATSKTTRDATSFGSSNMLSRKSNLPQPLFATTKANLKLASVSEKSRISLVLEKAKATLLESKQQSKEAQKENPYLLTQEQPTQGGGEKKIKQLQFHQKGRFISAANKLRKLAYIEQLRQRIGEDVRNKGIDTDIISDAIIKKDSAVPSVEWWDEIYLPSKNYSILDYLKELDGQGINYQPCSTYVYHPPPVTPAMESKPVFSKPLMLTEKERKKLRRQRRLEVQKEKREQVRLGLLAPEQSKLKMSNYMKILGNEALQEPTKAEAMVRQQIQMRLSIHEQANADRQLTDEGKRAKKKRKLREDLASGIHMVVFRVPCLSKSPQWKFKLVANANQNMLSGVAIVHKEQNLVIIEGGAKSTSRYSNLMLRRIRWDDEQMEDEASSSCKLIWQGSFSKSHFNLFEWIEFSSEFSILEYLKPLGLDYLWGLGKSLSSISDATAVLNIASSTKTLVEEPSSSVDRDPEVMEVDDTKTRNTFPPFSEH